LNGNSTTNCIMKLRLLPAFILLGVSVPCVTQAQFLGGLFGSKHKHKYKHVQPKPQPKALVKKKQEVTYPETVRKSRYRIDILASLYLDDLVNDGKLAYKDKMPDKATSGVAFCQGALLAMDTLKAMGYDMDVFIHDVNTQSGFPTGLIGNKQLDTSSLLIGAVGSKDIQDVAAFENRQHINFVSALSASDADVKDDKYFTLLQPSLQQHCAFIKKELQKKNLNDKITLFYRTDAPADDNAYHYLQTKDTTWSVRKVLCNAIPDKAVLDMLFDSATSNVIVMSITDIAYAQKLLEMLDRNYPGYRFEVYGMPSWKGMPSIHKTEALENIGINISAPFYFNQNSPTGKYLERSFKAKFNGHTGEMVYRGYETVFWYATLLHKYGTIFNTHVADNANAPFTKFSIKPEWDKNLDFLYDQNEHLYLYRYQGGSYMVAEQ